MRSSTLTTLLKTALVGLLLCVGVHAHAASLNLSPNTGVYNAGTTFAVRVSVNTQGQPINAAEGDIAFNPSDLSVIDVSKGGSIFSLWTREPAFSNAAGTVSFGGGSPSGYTGGSGTIVTITFRSKHEGTTNVTYTGGSVLAADGKGTNVISGMNGGSYTIQAVTSQPAPEYVPPANTPQAPNVTSATHPDQDAWYKETTAKLAWKLPSGVIAMRTLLDNSPTTVPTKVYENPISDIELTDLGDGTSYFHIQFKNNEGWGRVTNYRLNVDTAKPDSFDIKLADDNNTAHPEQRVAFTTSDKGSGIEYYMVAIDGGEKSRFEPEKKDAAKGGGSHTDVYTTPELAPGAHTIVAEAFDHAGNSVVGSFDLTVTAFGAPAFTQYPQEMSAGVIPVIRGTTQSNAKVEIFMRKVGADEVSYTVTADQSGTFTFIPESAFSLGVYELRAVATDPETGARSESSATIRIAVQESGLMRIGGWMVSALSVVIPLLALMALLAVGAWYGWHRIAVLRRKVRKEVTEAEQSLAHEFDGLVAILKENVEALKEYRKGKLTKQEQTLVDSLSKSLEGAERRVKKEIDDIEKLIKR